MIKDEIDTLHKDLDKQIHLLTDIIENKDVKDRELLMTLKIIIQNQKTTITIMEDIYRDLLYRNV